MARYSNLRPPIQNPNVGANLIQPILLILQAYRIAERSIKTSKRKMQHAKSQLPPWSALLSLLLSWEDQRISSSWARTLHTWNLMKSRVSAINKGQFGGVVGIWPSIQFPASQSFQQHRQVISCFKPNTEGPESFWSFLIFHDVWQRGHHHVYQHPR